MTVEIFAEAHQSRRQAFFWLGLIIIFQNNNRRGEGKECGAVLRCCGIAIEKAEDGR